MLQSAGMVDRQVRQELALPVCGVAAVLQHGCYQFLCLSDGRGRLIDEALLDAGPSRCVLSLRLGRQRPDAELAHAAFPAGQLGLRLALALLARDGAVVFGPEPLPES